MVGLTPIFAFLGTLLGFVIGLSRNLHHGWLALLGGSAGFAFAGLFCGAIYAVLLQWSLGRLDRFSKRWEKSRCVMADILYLSGFMAVGLVFLSAIMLPACLLGQRLATSALAYPQAV